jgi:hypothetical protein
MFGFGRARKWIDQPKHRRALLKVAFFNTYPWHGTILEPISRFLFSKANLLVTDIGQNLKFFQPDIVVVADAGVIGVLKQVAPKAKFIHVCHGLISKNQPSYSYHHADYICVSSLFVATHLQHIGAVPKQCFWPVGLPQMDSIVKKLSHKTNSEPSLLYAPTWNPTLSSAHMFSERLIECLRKEETWNIVIRPHPHSYSHSPELIELWRHLANSYSRVRLADSEESLETSLSEADLLISDASSLSFFFLACNRPIILMNNPDRFSDPASYDPGGIEWKWRDMGHETSSIEEVYSLISQLLLHEDERAANRNHYRQKLFDQNLDGNCAQRIAEKILTIGQNI